MNDGDDTRDSVTVPIQPTGSGVVDLEIARERDALADDGAIEGAIDEVADDDAPRSWTDTAAVEESEGHPS